MENQQIEYIEGESDECEWLQFDKLKTYAHLPANEQKELIDNFHSQKYFSRICKIEKESLIFFYIQNKIFFLNHTNIPQIFKKPIKTTYDNFHIWEFHSEILSIKVLDLKLVKSIDEEVDKKNKEKFIVIYLEKEIIIFEVEKFTTLLEKINSNNDLTNVLEFIKNNSLVIERNAALNTDNFIILENNSGSYQDESYHFFFLNHPKNIDNLAPQLKYFKINKKQIINQRNLGKLNSIAITDIHDFKEDIFNLEHIISNVFCKYLKEKLIFFKIEFFEKEPPKVFPALRDENNEAIIVDLKSLILYNKPLESEIIDIALIKNLKNNCLFISAFEYPNDSDMLNKNSVNLNFFITYKYDNSSKKFSDIKINSFSDTYYPADDVYNFVKKPIMDVLHVKFEDEILILSNSQDKQIETFTFSELDRLEIKFACLEDEYKFCLPVFGDGEEKLKLNSLPIGMTTIDFKFQGYEKERYNINADEVYAPYLLLVLDNYGRLFFSHLINKHLTEDILKKEEELKPIKLKGMFNFKNLFTVQQENLSSKIFESKSPFIPNMQPLFGNQMPQNNIFSSQSTQSNSHFNQKNESISSNQPSGNFNNIFGTNQVNNAKSNLFENNNKENKACEGNTNKFEGLFIKDNKPQQASEPQLFLKPSNNSNKKIEIVVDKKKEENTDKAAEGYEKIIQLNQPGVPSKEKNNFMAENQKIKSDNLINIEPNQPIINNGNNFIKSGNDADLSSESGSDSEFVVTTASNLKNKQCKKIFSNDINGEANKNLGLHLNQIKGEATPWYDDILEQFKHKKEKLEEIRKNDERILKEKFDKEIQEIEKNNQNELKIRQEEFNLLVKQVEQKEMKKKQIEDIRIKKQLELKMQQEVEMKQLENELKEKIFEESKKNICCNLEVYLEIIKNKVDVFVSEAKKIEKFQEEFKKHENIFNEIENEIEQYIKKKSEVEKEINLFYEKDYQKNVEYLSDRLNNLIEIILKNEQRLKPQEIEEFILNNQLNLTAENKKRVLSVKNKYEILHVKFEDKLKLFKKIYEDSKKLIDKFSNNETINNLLEIKEKYQGPMKKFNQQYSSNSCESDQMNVIEKNYNFNNIVKKEQIMNSNSNKFSQYEISHANIFEEIMCQYEKEYNRLGEEYAELEKTIENVKIASQNLNPNNIRSLGRENINKEAVTFDFNVCVKKVFCEKDIKSIYKNIRDNSSHCSRDPFENINLYYDLKQNLYRVLQNNIPKVEYIDDEGDDFDEIFDKDKKNSNQNNKKIPCDPHINVDASRENIKKVFSNLFSTERLQEIFKKYKDDNIKSRIEMANKQAQVEYEKKNKSLKIIEEELKTKENEKENFNKKASEPPSKAASNKSMPESKIIPVAPHGKIDISKNALYNTANDSNNQCPIKKSDSIKQNLKDQENLFGNVQHPGVQQDEKNRNKKNIDKEKFEEVKQNVFSNPFSSNILSQDQKPNIFSNQAGIDLKKEKEKQQQEINTNIDNKIENADKIKVNDNKESKLSIGGHQGSALFGDEKPAIFNANRSERNTNPLFTLSKTEEKNEKSSNVNNPFAPKSELIKDNKVEDKSFDKPIQQGLFSNIASNHLSNSLFAMNKESMEIKKDDGSNNLQKNNFSFANSTEVNNNNKDYEASKKCPDNEEPSELLNSLNLVNNKTENNPQAPSNVIPISAIKPMAENINQLKPSGNLNLFANKPPLNDQVKKEEVEKKSDALMKETNKLPEKKEEEQLKEQDDAKNLLLNQVNIQPLMSQNNNPLSNPNQSNNQNKDNKIFASPFQQMGIINSNQQQPNNNLFSQNQIKLGNSNTNQASGFSTFSAQLAQNNLISNMMNNQEKNNAASTGILDSLINPMQNHNMTFNNDSNAIPKAGFGQSSNLGAINSSFKPLTGPIGFGKNLNSNPPSNLSGFSGINPSNNSSGFFVNQNQGGFLQNNNSSFPNTGFVNNNQPASFTINNNQGFGGFNALNNQQQANTFFNNQQQAPQQNNMQINNNSRKNDYDF